MVDDQVRSILLNAIFIYLKNHFSMEALPTGDALNQQIAAADNETLKTALSFLKQCHDTVRMPCDYFKALRDVLAGYQGGKLAAVKGALNMNPSNLKLDFETAIKLAEDKHAELSVLFMKLYYREFDPRTLATAENRVRADLQLRYMDNKIDFIDTQLAVKIHGELTDLMVLARKDYLHLICARKEYAQAGFIHCPHILTVLEGYHRAHLEAYEATQHEFKNSVRFYNAIKIGAISKFHDDFLMKFDVQAAFTPSRSKLTEETKLLLASPLVDITLVEQLKVKLESHHRKLKYEKLDAKVKKLEGNSPEDGQGSDQELDYGNPILAAPK